jgi:tetratricopeptide (TPR) repeat protein
MARKVKRLTRKELLKEDNFTVSLRKAFMRAFENRKYVYLAVGSLLTLIILVIGIQYTVKVAETKSTRLFAEASGYYSETVSEEQKSAYSRFFAPDQADESLTNYADAAAKFEQVIENHPRSFNGNLSRLYAANSYFQLGEYAKSAELYQQYLDHAGSNQAKSFSSIALEGLGFSYEGIQDNEKALEAFKKLSGQKSAAFMERGMYNSARIYQAMGNTEKATEYYKRIVEEFPDSNQISLIHQILSQLELGS